MLTRLMEIRPKAWFNGSITLMPSFSKAAELVVYHLDALMNGFGTDSADGSTF